MVEAFWQGTLPAAGCREVEEDLRPALAPRFSLQPAARSRAVRRTWLDTFDWRLHRAGLTLEDSAGELTLTGPDGERITGPAGPARWPRQAAALPPGPLRARLCPVTGVRALMPVARTTGVERAWRVLNGDGKTVARLTVEEASAGGAGEAPTRLSLTPVRGYQAQAHRISHRLAGVPGVVPAPASAMQTALAATGRRPGGYTSRIDVELTAGMPATAALSAVLLRLLDTMEANVPGTVADIDTEFLHDLRVSVRRTRSALKLAGDVLPGGLAAGFRPEFTWLGDATTPTRDLDVHLLNFDSMAGGLVSAPAAGLDPLRDYLLRRRRAERRHLVRALRSDRFAHLTRTWRDALTSLPAPARPGGDRTHGGTGGDGLTAGVLAAGRIHRAHRRVMTRGAAITAGSPPEKLHDLRKRCKELRYALEFFESLHDPATHRRAVRDLKRLQDCLGTFQDCQVQQQQIQTIAARMMEDRSVPATALLAMGELAGQIAQRQRAARAEFAGRFAGFAGEASTGRFSALTSGARP